MKTAVEPVCEHGHVGEPKACLGCYPDQAPPVPTAEQEADLSRAGLTPRGAAIVRAALGSGVPVVLGEDLGSVATGTCPHGLPGRQCDLCWPVASPVPDTPDLDPVDAAARLVARLSRQLLRGGVVKESPARDGNTVALVVDSEALRALRAAVTLWDDHAHDLAMRGGR